MCEQHPFLGASPDSYVFGVVEMKCASQETDFCCKVHPQSTVELKRTHAYYCQVQGRESV